MFYDSFKSITLFTYHLQRSKIMESGVKPSLIFVNSQIALDYALLRSVTAHLNRQMGLHRHMKHVTWFGEWILPYLKNNICLQDGFNKW